MNRLVQDYNEGCESSVSQNILQQSKHIAPYPFQMALTNPLKKESLRREMTDLSSMWCGQGVSMCSDQKVSQLVEKWELELEEQNKVCC
mmetsp:Transcript_30098/g.47885  ORF Transcript_30098/g.47885 Transcript_30098/m.47885 type:complete len:89 (+) Transcript_30098:992-1258(+)